MPDTENANMKQQKIKLLEAKRALYYSQITKTYNLTAKKDEKSRFEFKLQVRSLDRIRDEYVNIVDEINLLNLQINPEYVINYQTLATFDEMYNFIKEVFEQQYNKSSSSGSPPVTKEGKEHTVKIPRIDLPTFDGEIHNFPFFYETFKRVIHENENLTDSERVHYLISHLTGKAKTVCAGITPAGENYKIIWQALIDKYKDDRALATSYLNQLFALKSISGPSANNLEKFIDKYAAIIAALKQLDSVHDMGDFIFVYIGLKLVDSDTAKSFETSIRENKEMPKYDEFVKFIREHVKILYRTTQRSGKSDNFMPPSQLVTNSRPSRALVATQPTMTQRALTYQCTLCKGNAHSHMYACKQFSDLSPLDKFKFIKENKHCINCLSSQHTAYNCNSNTTCRKCNAKHHTLLHFGKSQSSTATLAINEESQINEILDTPELAVELAPDSPSEYYSPTEEESPEVSFCTLSSTKHDSKVTTQILATAKVYATARNGRDVVVRCLLDPGSQKHYITSKCCHRLGLTVKSGSPVAVKGIGGSTQMVRGEVSVGIRSRYRTDSRFTIHALVLNKITSDLPTCHVDTSFFDSLTENIPMADDEWGTPGEIDLLLGVSLFAEMLRPGRIVGKHGCPDALETVLGYIVLGDAPTVSVSTSSVSCHAMISTCDVDNLVRKFWELEEIDLKPVLSDDDKRCEEIYRTTTTRDSSGRYEVALPFKSNPELLGNSFDVAKRRYLHLERKFTAHPELKTAYDEVINDYLKKGYLSPVESVASETHNFYIPHHAVLRDDKVTTKVRPVLDASAKSSSGLSLNDILYTGPNLQRELFTILLNMRLFSVAISADVRQMYLRIGVRDQDRRFQRILYRLNETNLAQTSDDRLQTTKEPSRTLDNLIDIRIYEFNRVAFGVKCSPFLALRTVSQLAEDESHCFPVANEIVKRDLYMDDIASSLMTSDQAITASQELIKLFMAGGFQLAKWSSNCKQVLEQIPEDYRLYQNVEFNKDDTLKILGLCWHPRDDVFLFKVTTDERVCSKRNILSSIARLFDVLGLVAPIILFAKLLIKDLWIAKIDWDEIPPQRIIRLWRQFQTELPEIAKLRFPRHLRVVAKSVVTILGFADASERAYGGVVYLHVTTQEGNTSILLTCAKSKVAPLKVVSLARLELCAALLLSKLMKKVLETYSPRYPIHSIMAFSDSTVALSWIHSSPHRWQTFVANRVAKIHDNLSPDCFYHVKGSENPSDCLSRGLTPVQLLNHPLWLHGPPWAHLPKREWPITPFIVNETLDVPEKKSISLLTTTSEEPFLYKFACKFSNWRKLLRNVCAIFKLLKKIPKGSVTNTDLEFAEREVLMAVQMVHFSSDINNLKNNKPCSSSRLKLNPFLENGLLRVGGRLENSEEDFDYKHPVLLPGKDLVVEMLVRYIHWKNLHTGPGLLTSVLRARYWILSARRLIRAVVSKCNVCFRFKPRPNAPLMGDLPEPRVREAHKAFVHTGCDYAGPFLVTPYRGRGITSRKAYICLFTCLSTRAVHIELASEMSSACFLAALKRFLSRRGPVQCLYTDHGTNFIGARSYLKDLYTFLAGEYSQVWEKELAESRIQWKLIPPNAPHFGGCWESNIKCVKSHLYKVIGLQILTFEELLTVLTQVESLLNSRPLTVLNADPTEPAALTPAHFLHTVPLKFLPASDISNISASHLISRYDLLDRLVQSFWKRWRVEYLHTLQVRQKWNTPTLPIKEGMVVVIMQDNVTPLHWPLGVIVKIMPGRDGVVRVAMVKTKYGTYQRPVVKLCPLPTQ